MFAVKVSCCRLPVIRLREYREYVRVGLAFALPTGGGALEMPGAFPVPRPGYPAAEPLAIFHDPGCFTLMRIRACWLPV